MLVDSHCHLDYMERRGQDVAAIVQQAENAGVTRLLTVATTLAGEETLRGYCDTFPHVYRSVGVHPCHAHEEPNTTAEKLIALSKQDKVIALGECGVDYFHDSSQKDTQHQVFHEHLKAAQETDLPLIIHTRDADNDTISIMQEAFREKPFRGVFHCYIGSEAILTAAQEMDFYISVTGILTYGKSGDLRQQMAKIDPKRLMVETDAPFLAPKPHRGKPCTPAMVRHTAEFLAELLGIDFGVLSQQTTENFLRLFNRATSQ